MGDKKGVSVIFEKELFDDLALFAKTKGWPIALVIRTAVRQYVQDQNPSKAA
ncbi:hypothetical protein KP003_16840 [Geomonas nitrogeniifigens]|uniref:hypothetical protein n=1 Tax=Geomonas diazotrophica TaxID=2843197 RepID=UPI001C2C8889|nr:hypothetical protein [Geomonas nitrogeniifigens]QXE86009.1 hypothetical protein KP003_16840 [Geomonas nitrogeniifigens]